MIRFRIILATISVTLATPFEASALLVQPSDFPAIFSSPCDEAYALITLDEPETDNDKSVDFDFSVTSALQLVTTSTFTPPALSDAGIESTSFHLAIVSLLNTAGNPVALFSLTDYTAVQVSNSFSYSFIPGDYTLRVSWEGTSPTTSGNLFIKTTGFPTPPLGCIPQIEILDDGFESPTSH